MQFIRTLELITMKLIFQIHVSLVYYGEEQL